ncbi:GIY-YIG nuclease family protein [Vibrio sp. J2-4]|uniref:GIY-YIG nuclease family protein n=1 Tax=Vibrio sp. J2-4 TaxID=1507977 RepID=UPI001F28A949|nr:GIY-YIG nuclease family protein [Vibrio sp. J2-4]MCF7479780.1 GIY-YIG nuclease family protein [Vibrio sp. J2-4]
MYKSINFTDDNLIEMPDPFDYSDLSPSELEIGLEKFESFIRDDDAPRYLYVIRCAETNYFKIGITNNISKRLSTHQTGCPFELKLVLYCEPELEDLYAREIVYLEKFLHNNYKDLCVRGEWYELSFEHISDIIFFLENNRELPVMTTDDDSLSVYNEKVGLILKEEGWV